MPHTTKRDTPGREIQEERISVDANELVNLLTEFMQGDEEEQRATFEHLRRSLDEDRPAGYKLFS